MRSWKEQGVKPHLLYFMVARGSHWGSSREYFSQELWSGTFPPNAYIKRGDFATHAQVRAMPSAGREVSQREGRSSAYTAEEVGKAPRHISVCVSKAMKLPPMPKFTEIVC